MSVFLSGGTAAGVYTVHLERAGYAAWEVRGVPVVSGECGIETTTLTARMQPVAGA